MPSYSELYFGALLCDFPCFYNRPVEGFLKKYNSLFARYCDVEAVSEIAALSPARKESETVKAARNLSLFQCRDQSDGKGLASVFSFLTAGETDAPERKYYPVAMMDMHAIFPQKEAIADDRGQAAAFEKEMDAVAANPPADENAFMTVLDTVLKKYLWCVPIKPGDDISLYDHLKMTAAITVCLHAAGTEQPYKLVAGDFSGIQNYIFSVSKTGTKGVAKRLRARSFYVDATVTVLAHALTDRFQVPKANILMLTGGKFYLLLPNTADSDAKLEAFRREADTCFYNAFHGEISVNLAWLNIGPEGLENYSAAITELSRRLSQQKNRQFSDVLVKSGLWDETAFVIADDLHGKTLCPACRRNLVKAPESGEAARCAMCEAHTRLGQELPHAGYIVYSRGSGEYRLFGDYYMTPAQKPKAVPGAYLVEQLNCWDIAPALWRMPLAVRVMANNLPVDEQGEVMTFSDLAQKAAGTKKLGVLKADVDNLGYLFSDGLRTKDRHYGTISRVATMSRMLEWFFSGYVYKILRESFPDVYSVFSGGDDLFLIGPWDKLPDLARRLQRDFRTFAAENPAVTLSAAICVAAPKTHIASLAELCEERLKQVKSNAPEAVYPGKGGRNGVYFMDEIFSWEDFSNQLDNGKKLAELPETVNISVLRRIAQYSAMYRKFLRTHDPFCLMFQPLFHYDRRRNYDKIKGEQASWFFEYAERLSANAANYKVIKKDLYFAAACVRYALNKTKEVRGNGL